jgi:hypothetical protein
MKSSQDGKFENWAQKKWRALLTLSEAEINLIVLLNALIPTKLFIFLTLGSDRTSIP